MGRFGLSSNDDSDDEVLMYPQDHGGDERTSSTGRDQTLSNRALSTLVHPVPGVAVEDTSSSSSSSSIREAMRRNEYYDFTIRGNHHACDQYGPLYEYARVRPGNEEACSSRRRRSSKTYFYYWKQFVFVMLLIVMQRYLPPPPPPVDSWGGYISHSTQGIKATITNLVALTMYIVKGCIHNINEDLGMVMRSFLFRQGKPNIPISQDCIPCPLKVPIDNRDEPNQSLESIRNTLQSNFVGKSAEIDILSKALVKWDSSSLSNKRPLNMIFVGSDGVGKYEVAKQVGELLIHHDCQSDCNNPCSSCVSFHPSHILHLQGINHALNEESCAKSLIRQILNHVYKQKNEGAVVILRHVEDLGDAAKRELIRLLRMPNVTFSVQDDDDDDTMVSGASVANSNLLERFLFGKEDKSQMIPTRKEVVVRLDNCVFLFTTDLGSDEIFRGLSNSAFKASGLLLDQVARDIQEKLQRFFGVNVSENVSILEIVTALPNIADLHRLMRLLYVCNSSLCLFSV
jgi:ATPases with chaperone activity, ATP-binding subunit